MTSNFIDQFGFNDDEFTEQDENIKWVWCFYYFILMKFVITVVDNRI